MGSKFGKHNSVQPTPAVCKKPPSGLPPPFPDLQNVTLLAWSSIAIPRFTFPILFTATYECPPEPPPFFWEGITAAGRFQFLSEVTWNDSTERLNVDLTFFIDAIPAFVFNWPDVIPVSTNPFDSSLLYRRFGVEGGLVQTTYRQ